MKTFWFGLNMAVFFWILVPLGFVAFAILAVYPVVGYILMGIGFVGMLLVRGSNHGKSR